MHVDVSENLAVSIATVIGPIRFPMTCIIVHV